EQGDGFGRTCSVVHVVRVINREDLCWCIKQHQEILLFADELIPPIRALAYTTVSLTKILMITSGFFLISDEILPVKIQFGIVAISLTFNTFLYSWAADHLVNI
ncbi:GSCOCT00014007001.2-RA-CDS, partial [Cotesia congregata]